MKHLVKQSPVWWPGYIGAYGSAEIAYSASHIPWLSLGERLAESRKKARGRNEKAGIVPNTYYRSAPKKSTAA